MISLKSYNTFGVESFASELFCIHNEQELLNLELDVDKGIKILGGGSNILLTKDIKETILKNEIKGIEIIEDHPEYTNVKIGAGENWNELVIWALKNNLGGIENLSLIPGSVGAAPLQNIGAYGVELKNVLVSVDGLFLKDRRKKTFKNLECRFSYRNSLFKSELKESFFITSIVLQLQKKHQLHLNYGAIQEELQKSNIKNPTIQDVSSAVIKIRNSKLPDPKLIGNAGSFFKNSIISNALYHELKTRFPQIPGFNDDPEHTKVPSGWLVEQCGWKGMKIGEVGCYDKQALVLVNYGNASGSDILKLADAITVSVFEKFGIDLVPEVNIW